MYQLVLLKSGVISQYFEPGKLAGDVVWVRSIEAAQHLIENHVAEWPKGAPREVQEDAAPAERKSFGDRTAGPLTDSPSSSGPGKAILSSASAGALVSHHRL